MQFLADFMDFLTNGGMYPMDIKANEAFEDFVLKAALKISQSGFVKTDENWKQEPMYASFSRLYYVLDGSGMLIGENEQMSLECGNVYLAPCGSKCGFYGTDSVTKLFFHINLSLTDGGEDIFERYGRFAKLPKSVSYMEKLKQLYLSGKQTDFFILKNEIEKNVCEFLDLDRIDGDNERKYSRPVSEALRFIKENLCASLTVDSVAAAALCSRSSLSSFFKREIGLTVAKYIDELLFSEAQSMLLYEDMSVGEISESLGFCDQFYFSRRFSKRFGISPNKYRRASLEKQELRRKAL